MELTTRIAYNLGADYSRTLLVDPTCPQCNKRMDIRKARVAVVSDEKKYIIDFKFTDWNCLDCGAMKPKFETQELIHAS
jgi:hypothetical protein